MRWNSSVHDPVPAFNNDHSNRHDFLCVFLRFRCFYKHKLVWVQIPSDLNQHPHAERRPCLPGPIPCHFRLTVSSQHRLQLMRKSLSLRFINWDGDCKLFLLDKAPLTWKANMLLVRHYKQYSWFGWCHKKTCLLLQAWKMCWQLISQSGCRLMAKPECYRWDTDLETACKAHSWWCKAVGKTGYSKRKHQQIKLLQPNTWNDWGMSQQQTCRRANEVSSSASNQAPSQNLAAGPYSILSFLGYRRWWQSNSLASTHGGGLALIFM